MPSESRPTPESDIRFYTYDLKAIDSDSSDDQFDSVVGRICTALCKIDDLGFEPALDAWLELGSAYRRKNRVPHEELKNLLIQFPNLDRWSEGFRTSPYSADWKLTLDDLQLAANKAFFASDFIELRDVCRKMLQLIDGRQIYKRQKVVKGIFGTFLNKDLIDSNNQNDLLKTWEETKIYFVEKAITVIDRDIQAAKQDFSLLMKNCMSTELDSVNQMSAALRRLGRPDLALHKLKKVEGYEGKYFAPHFDTTILSVLLQLRKLDEAAFFAERLSKPGTLTNNPEVILKVLWRYHKLCFIEDGDFHHIAKITEIIERMRSTEMSEAEVTGFKELTQQLQDPTVRLPVNSSPEQANKERNLAPSTRKALEKLEDAIDIDELLDSISWTAEPI